jgi:hypothetical protein
MSLVWQISGNENFGNSTNTLLASIYMYNGSFLFEYLKQSKVISTQIQIHYPQRRLGKWNANFGIYIVVISEDTHFFVQMIEVFLCMNFPSFLRGL